jgi:hypothetical protein
MTHHTGGNPIHIWQSALNSGVTAASTPLTLRSTIVPDRWQGSSQPRRSFEGLLLEHCERIFTKGHSQMLFVQLDLRFEGICPATHEKTVLRVADELLSNAMEHGFYGRQRGHVVVRVISRAGICVEVSVSDDGWGFDSGPMIDGNGFCLLRQVGDLHIETTAERFAAKTAVTVIMPLHRRRVAAVLASKERIVI